MRAPSTDSLLTLTLRVCAAGRFDRQILVGLPDLEGRIEVLTVHLSKRQWDASDVRLKELAFETQQFSGAMIANLVNNAALLCARADRDVITHADLEGALDIERIGARRFAPTPTIHPENSNLTPKG